jgi:hypothetical protein
LTFYDFITGRWFYIYVDSSFRPINNWLVLNDVRRNMAGYYCHECALKMGLLHPAEPMILTGTEYQLNKYLKHTAPTSDYNFNTIFTGPASSTYHSYIVTTIASGHVQVDDRGRTNVLWVASGPTGITFHKGNFAGPTNAVKVVYHDNENKIHGFPIQSSALGVATCVSCGRPIPY